MSRIGNRRITVPAGVEVKVEDNNLVTVKGPKGELTNKFNEDIIIKQDGDVIVLERKNESVKALHGTTNALLSNMIEGVSKGFEKGLEMVGVGYRFNLKGKKLEISAGFSHPVVVEIPDDIDIEQISNTEIKLSGINKQRVTSMAAKIRDWSRPEPYKGKGIRYKGEHIRRKEGKKAS